MHAKLFVYYSLRSPHENEYKSILAKKEFPSASSLNDIKWKMRKSFIKPSVGILYEQSEMLRPMEKESHASDSTTFIYVEKKSSST